MRNPDVLGDCIRKAYKTNKDVWIDLELNGHSDESMNASYFLRSFEEMPILERRAMKLSKGKILDVGAAAGSHSLYLQKLGYDVTSLEQSEICCEVMQERGLNQVICKNLFDFNTVAKYDTILLLMNGWGMGATFDGMYNFLLKLTSLLNPGGQIIGDTSDIRYWSEEKSDDTLTISNLYHGEVIFKVSHGSQSQEFNWIYPSPNLLFDYFKSFDLDGSIEAEGPNWDYLIQAQRKS